MQYDLLIRGGTLIDGSGLPRYRADVGIARGRIASIGRIRDGAREVLDAEGCVVAPGFVDGHTHMDAQICWDPLGTCSCWHGVTSVVMGNCGFTLAPSRRRERELVVRNLERAEDISAEAMAAGIEWTWETYPEYLDTLERLPKGINYAGQIGHSALRTFAMGERAFEQAASADDLERMARELRDALRAGAIGFTTSRSYNHQTSDDRPVASRLASWDEVRALVGTMGEMNAGIFEIANEDTASSPEALRDYHGRLLELALESGRPITWGIGSSRREPDRWRPWMALAEETAHRGGRMFAQVHAREFSVVLSFKTHLPYDQLPLWKELRARPLEEQRRTLLDPEARRRLIEVAHTADYGHAIGAEARKPDYDWIWVLERPGAEHRSVAEIARERGDADPLETLIDLALAKDFDQFFLQPFANEDPYAVLQLMKHPRSVVTFSDSGAHVSQIMDSSIPTHVLAYWVRERQALTLEEAVRMLSFDLTTAWGFADRGLIREGFAADVVVFDPDTVAPALPEVDTDLPGGARRLKQRATGIAATVVNGEVLLREGEHTGALPGELLRGPLARHI
jgi:N-acyl-D-aspartate/D-glutamate deacylase